MSKGALDTFRFVINFLTKDWEPKHVTLVCLRQKGLIELFLLVNASFV